MKKIIILLALLIPTSGVVYAENTTYKQQILPIDCIYEVIDVGTQKLRYLTPETCPIDPGPPVVTEPSGGGETTPQTTPATNWVYIAPIAIAQPDNEQNPSQEGEVEAATEEIKDLVYKNRDSIFFLLVVSTVWVVTIFALRKRKF